LGSIVFILPATILMSPPMVSFIRALKFDE
jgi:hypothetical protein